MADLVAVAFDDPADAFALRAELAKLQKDYLIDMEDAVVVTHEEGGKVRLHQPVNLTAAGALGGTMWGALVGLIFLNPLLGAVVGAGAGAVSGWLTDIGVDDARMKEMGEALPEGGAALFVLVRKFTGDKLLERLEAWREKGRVIQTSLSEEQEQRLRALVEKAEESRIAPPAA
ncbi:DUF1269 domain-containing protein [Rubrimonas cliftonensis]|uniref:Uncharacterized membrane protein n=1 Tax=Rubrimonas cliftonensis TaxID=89524 RepID=A0A1H3VM04_9RHOB|nr:DUF1269 domain-containing protein [Rubrimonas cliftonensis]SDZ75827.1 Uncharacterized membrane protein [Rubrimonas cliftonensis]